MSESKNLGIISQMYEDRKTGKTGVLVARDDENHRMMMRNGEEQFSISMSAFKSNWRKFKVDEAVVEDAAVSEAVVDEPVVDEATTEEVKPQKKNKKKKEVAPMREIEPVKIEMSDADAVAEFNKTSRNIVVNEIANGYEFFKDGIIVMRATREDYGYHLEMKPDVHTFSDFRRCGYVSMSYEMTIFDSQHLDISIDCEANIAEIIEVSKCAMENLNMNAYDGTVEKILNGEIK